MDKFLSDKRVFLFIGSVLVAVAGWGMGFSSWGEMFAPKAFFGLLFILGSLLTSNVTSNILKKPPIITETTEPASQVTTVTTTTTPPETK